MFCSLEANWLTCSQMLWLITDSSGNMLLFDFFISSCSLQASAPVRKVIKMTQNREMFIFDDLCDLTFDLT